MADGAARGTEAKAGAAIGTGRIEQLKPIVSKCRVIYSFPELNVYAVQPRDGLVFAGEVAYLMAIDTTAHSCTSKVGVTDGSSYAPGAEVSVLFLVPNNPDADNEVGYDMSLYGQIIGPSYFHALDSSKVFVNDMLDDPFINYFNNQIRNAVSKSIMNNEFIQDRSFGRPIDTTAGDFVKSNMFGGSIRLTMMRASVGASARAQIQMSALDDSIDITASRLSHQSDAVHHTEYPAWDDYNRIHRYARTMSEGLGAALDALKPNETEKGYLFEPLFDDQQGIFRDVSIRGPLVEGQYDMYINPEKVYKGGEARRESKIDTPQFGLSAIQRTYDGSVNIQGVKNVGMQRSAYVWTPREIEMEDNNQELLNIDLEPPAADWSRMVNIPQEERADYASLMKDKRTEHSLQRYFTQITQKEEQSDKLWKTYSKEDVEKEYGSIVDVETKLTPIKEDEDSYSDTPTVEITDPLRPDEKIKLQALLSAIELDETGAAYWHDGHGSEIRFSRGHITIAPALDIKLRPGRSVIGKIPKDMVIRARQYVEVSSDQNDVLVKAQRDMKLLSGNGKSGGMMTLENRSTVPYDATKRTGESRSGGISIKSYSSNLSVTAPDIYMGLFAPTDTSRKGRTSTAAGTLTIDAGAGVLSTSGKSKLDVFTAGIMSIVNNSSMLSIDSSGVVVAGSLMGISCATVKCGSITDNPVYPVVTESGVENRTMNINTPSVSFEVDGTLKAKTGIFAGSLLSDLVSANTCTANNGAFGNASDHSQLQGGSGPGGAINIGAITISTASLTGILRGMTGTIKQSVLEQSGFTGYGILYSGFFFQQDNKYDTKGLVEARYQRMLRKGEGPVKFWKEGVDGTEDEVSMPESVTGSGETTQAWPGKEAPDYNVKTISDDGLDSENKGPFRDAYIINTQK